MVERTSHQEGFRAHAEGKELHENPYDANSLNAAAWQAGWRAREQHMRDRDSALTGIW